MAQPHLRDPNFHAAVVFLVRHDESGAFGLIVNRPMGSQRLNVLLEAMGGDPEGTTGEITIHLGGPVQTSQGFVLHSREGGREPMIAVNDRYGVTASVDLLQAIGKGDGPKHAMLALGYAGWGAGQLESEIGRGDWAIAPADDVILFGEEHEAKWRRAFDSRYVET